ncbi:SidA/IucD/PvdA family monooxygenase [Bradyrhizobium sp. 13971]
MNVLESSEKVKWHPGLLLAGAVMQTSPLKDLVTPADPTSAYSFLAYLHDKKRLYQAIVRGWRLLLVMNLRTICAGQRRSWRTFNSAST